jgi:DNA-binding NtrC family response regulator
VLGISAEAVSILFPYDWPGNVRELQNIIQQATALGSGDLIEPEDLPEALFASRLEAEAQTLEQAVLKAKREFVENVFELAGGDDKEAAAMLGIHPKGMHRFFNKLNLSHLMRIRKERLAGAAR